MDAPEFPYNPESQMAKMAEDAYKETYGFMPKLEVNCCSLQLGMLIQKKNLDCVGLGTEIFDIHSPRERMNLESVAKTWDMTRLYMKMLCNA